MTAPPVALSDRLQRSAAARAAPAGDALVLLHLERGTYYTLNASGAFLWERLDGATTLAELAAALAARFAIDVATARADLAALVAELLAEGLIEPAPAAGAAQSSKAGS